jgi:antitoxin (DNA-binding transcriptional repressor) of toxin-antitoxin stability system
MSVKEGSEKLITKTCKNVAALIAADRLDDQHAPHSCCWRM